jgi:GR25 family glycosyltransferase involved in LPS biosynthesis
MDHYRGIYINLDRSPDRRAEIGRQLQNCGIAAQYSRFSAIDGSSLKRPPGVTITPGEAGAFHSHAHAIRDAASRGLPLHVLEDDALLSAEMPNVIAGAIAAGLLDRFDVLFTDTLVAADLGMLKALLHACERIAGVKQLRWSDLQLFDISRQNFACLTSYVVSPKALQRLSTMLDAELQNGPTLPVDLFLRQCAHAGKLSVGLLAPFVTSFRLEDMIKSTIGAGHTGTISSVKVMAVLRYLFFVERDLAAARSLLGSAQAGSRHGQSDQMQLILQALEFVLSDEFRQF